jgi:hypothetical protein
MKTAGATLLTLFTAFCLSGQIQAVRIILTSKDVDTNSVRVITSPNIPTPNLVFKYVGKTSEEIKAIGQERPQVQVMKNGIIVAETGRVSLWHEIKKGQTNCVGLVLIFDNYDQAKLVEKTLRGN